MTEGTTEIAQPLRVQHRKEFQCSPFYYDGAQWERAGVLEPWPVLAVDGYDAMLLSALDFITAGERVEDFGPFGLSFAGSAGDIHLYSERPITHLGGCRIAIAGEPTAVALLQIILAYTYRVWPAAFVTPDQPHDAILTTSIGQPDLPYAYDLCQEWQAWQQAPFVSAIWVVRPEVSSLGRATVNYLLGTSIQQALTEPGKIAARFGLDEKETGAYFASCHYRLTTADHDAFSLFRRLWLNLATQIAAVRNVQPVIEKIAA